MPQFSYYDDGLRSFRVTSSGLLPDVCDYPTYRPEESNVQQQVQVSDHPEKPCGKIKTKVDDTGDSTNSFRRIRTAFTPRQVYHLEKEFAKDPYIARNQRKALSQLLGLPEVTIKVWYQNRRMKDKRTRMTVPWQFNPQSTSVYGNAVVKNPPMIATYPVPIPSSVPSQIGYSPIAYYGYPDVQPAPPAYGYSLYANCQERLMPDSSKQQHSHYSNSNSSSPVSSENGVVPSSLGPFFPSTTPYPLSTYYHYYRSCGSCVEPDTIAQQPLNLDTKNLNSTKKEENCTVKTAKVNTKPALFRPFD